MRIRIFYREGNNGDLKTSRVRIPVMIDDPTPESEDLQMHERRGNVEPNSGIPHEKK